MAGGVARADGGVAAPAELPSETSIKPARDSAARCGRCRFLCFPQLGALAVVTVLAASSTVPLADISFVIFSVPYIYTLSCLSFPYLKSNSHDSSPIFGSRNTLFVSYISAAFVIGLLLPILYILEGFLSGDKAGVSAAAPHVFLLSAQVFLEGVTFSSEFSLPIRAFVPIFYNTRRLFTIADWMQHEMRKGDEESTPRWRLRAGRMLAVMNMALWAFNLLGFLLPVYLPRALKRHYCDEHQDDRETAVAGDRKGLEAPENSEKKLT